MIVLLNKNGVNISSTISLETPARGLIEVKISHHRVGDTWFPLRSCDSNVTPTILHKDVAISIRKFILRPQIDSIGTYVDGLGCTFQKN